MPEPPPAEDPDVDLHLPAHRAELRRGRASLLGAVALGGALGAGARYGVTLLWPAPHGGFPWAVACVNTAGCALIGVFMVLHEELGSPHRLLRPFVGVGVLGGFTTFSTYAADTHTLLAAGRHLVALADLAAVPLLALAAVGVSARATRACVARIRNAEGAR